ncbi:hypothetical protein MGYG_07990 [Nannizzia gypsea CBS 118893]|uniref:Uncharacterized protein n=1 Tax=Arthroderma gypseum (strain ATCC MYA-4604 / CBS 118893) TaxID=535722 RepID=E4V4R3_ARTGP|nr:hypothetical protein MGYG_07990 [Nannizzia gypsea CBS 118893]EFR04987.1 hypothetical protein MGYG_07990 [Nannizzia gypsea CBS 118893]
MGGSISSRALQRARSSGSPFFGVCSFGWRCAPYLCYTRQIIGEVLWGLAMMTEDVVRASLKAKQAIFDKGFRVWSTLYHIAQTEKALPESCLQLQRTFTHLPHFTLALDLKNCYGVLYATRSSTWETNGPKELPFVEKDLKIYVSATTPTRLTLSSDHHHDYRKWFGCNEDHISLGRQSLCLALYLSTPIASQPRKAVIRIPSYDAVRWWKAVLAPGKGWRACIPSDKADYKTPWSIQYSPPQGLPISSSAALHYLSEYCNLHNTMDQSHAALSVAIMFSLPRSRRQHVCLPAPRLRRGGRTAPNEAKTQIGHEWIQMSCHLDKLLVLSCNTRGVESLLSNIFYDSEVACNLVSPWLKAAFAILDSVNGNLG